MKRKILEKKIVNLKKNYSWVIFLGGIWTLQLFFCLICTNKLLNWKINIMFSLLGKCSKPCKRLFVTTKRTVEKFVFFLNKKPFQLFLFAGQFNLFCQFENMHFLIIEFCFLSKFLYFKLNAKNSISCQILFLIFFLSLCLNLNLISIGVVHTVGM